MNERRFSSDDDLLRAWDNECAKFFNEMWQMWLRIDFGRLKFIAGERNYFEKMY